jgi:hypothetical protein
MTPPIKIALIIAVGIIVAMSLYLYFTLFSNASAPCMRARTRIPIRLVKWSAPFQKRFA